MGGKLEKRRGLEVGWDRGEGESVGLDAWLCLEICMFMHPILGAVMLARSFVCGES